jgi:hypothetical protein
MYFSTVNHSTDSDFFKPCICLKVMCLYVIVLVSVSFCSYFVFPENFQVYILGYIHHLSLMCLFTDRRALRGCSEWNA